jgi:hypothetical protein
LVLLGTFWEINMNLPTDLPPGITQLDRAVQLKRKEGYMTPGDIAFELKTTSVNARIVFDPPDLILKRGNMRRNLYLRERVLKNKTGV